MSKDETTEAPFDIEEWLSDAHLPEVTVRVNKFGHLAARLADLDAAHDAAKREDAKDVRLSSKNGAAYPIAQEIEQVRAQMESGWLTIRLRGLTTDELERGNKAKGDGQAIRFVAMQAVEPKMNVPFPDVSVFASIAERSITSPARAPGASKKTINR